MLVSYTSGLLPQIYLLPGQKSLILSSYYVRDILAAAD